MAIPNKSMRGSDRARKDQRFGVMLLIIAILLVLLWGGGFLAFHVASGLIHLLLLFALISLVFHFVRGGSRRV